MAFSLRDDLLTTAEVAKLTGRAQATLRGAIASGTLMPYDRTPEGHWLILRDEALRWAQRPVTFHRRHYDSPAADRTAALLAEHGPLTATNLAALTDVHVGNARKHLAQLAKQGRAERLADGNWVLLHHNRQEGRLAS